MSELDLDAIEARAKAARVGPWKHVEMGRVFDAHALVTAGYVKYPGDDDPEDETPETLAAEKLTEDTGKFIAHAREDVPALIAELRRLREENVMISNAFGDSLEGWLADKTELTKLREENKWIPVTERLPGRNDRYITFSGTYGVYALWFDQYNFSDCGDEIRDVTHWREMPTPPEVGNV